MSGRKILVVGAGGIGGYCGGRLAERGEDVTFLVRKARQRVIETNGLVIESPFGDTSFPVKTVLAEDVRPEFDVVILACKSYDLETAIAAFQPGLVETGVVLPLLNGLAHIDMLNQVFGAQRVLGGSIKIQVAVSPEGVIRQLNDWRFITFGEQTGEMTARVQVIESAFSGARGIEAVAVDNIMQCMWEKIVHLSTAAAMTCLMRANVGEIVRTPYGKSTFMAVLDGIAAVATESGFGPSPLFMENYRKTFTDEQSLYTTSMLRDLERHSLTEVDHVVGFMLEKSRAAHIDIPALSLAFTHVKAYEQRRAAGRLLRDV